MQGTFLSADVTMKDIKLAERYKIEFRADVFNLLNHRQFQNASFNTNVGTGTGTTNGAQPRFSSEREMQFAFRFVFSSIAWRAGNPVPRFPIGSHA